MLILWNIFLPKLYDSIFKCWSLTHPLHLLLCHLPQIVPLPQAVPLPLLVFLTSLHILLPLPLQQTVHICFFGKSRALQKYHSAKVDDPCVMVSVLSTAVEDTFKWELHYEVHAKLWWNVHCPSDQSFAWSGLSPGILASEVTVPKAGIGPTDSHVVQKTWKKHPEESSELSSPWSYRNTLTLEFTVQ